MPRTAWSQFDVVECWGFSLASRSFWSWLPSFFMLYFWHSYESWMEFPCEWWLRTFQGFDFGEDSPLLYLQSMWISYLAQNCKADIWFAYLWITATSHSPAVSILVSPCFEDKDNVNEIALELNIICHSKKGANAKRTLSYSLEKTDAWQWQGQKKLQRSPSQSLSSMTWVSEAQFKSPYFCIEHLAHHAF